MQEIHELRTRRLGHALTESTRSFRGAGPKLRLCQFPKAGVGPTMAESGRLRRPCVSRLIMAVDILRRAVSLAIGNLIIRSRVAAGAAVCQNALALGASLLDQMARLSENTSFEFFLA